MIGYFNKTALGKAERNTNELEQIQGMRKTTRRNAEREASGGESAELNRAITRFKEITTSIALKYSEQSTV